MTNTLHAEVGDLIVIRGHRLGDHRRTGQIVDVLGTAGNEHYRVRWEDDHEGIFYPGGDAVVEHVQHAEDEQVLVHEP